MRSNWWVYGVVQEKMFAVKRNASVRRNFQFANYSLVQHVTQTMTPINHKRIISTGLNDVQSTHHIVNESHFPQPPTRTLKALPNSDINIVSTAVTAGNVHAAISI